MKEEVMKNFEAKKNSLEEVYIRKVGVLSVGVTFALIGLVIGLVLAILMIPFYSFLSQFVSQIGFISGTSSPMLLLTLPLVYGFGGLISGLVFALLYNLSAMITKGIKLYS